MKVAVLAVLALAFVVCVSARVHLVHPDDAVRNQIIETVNNHPAALWNAGINTRFQGHSFDKTRRLCGVKPSGTKLPVKAISPIQDLPTNFDSRDEWTMCESLKEIRDQSDCGSCWAFGAVEAATDRVCIQSKGASKPHFSATDLLACCDECGDGCNGGDPGSAWSWFTTTGVVTGGNYLDNSWCSAYPFTVCDHHVVGKYTPCGSGPEYSTPQCPTACDANSTYTISYSDDKHMFATSYSVPSDETSIMTEIMDNGPVEAAFTVYADFESYKSGVYHHVTGAELGGHAVKIIGWGVDATTSAKYWLVVNSWNEDWGDQGTFKILRGSDECGIEDGIVAGLFKSQ